MFLRLLFLFFLLGKDAEPYVFILGLQKYLLYAASGKVIHFDHTLKRQCILQSDIQSRSTINWNSKKDIDCL